MHSYTTQTQTHTHAHAQRHAHMHARTHARTPTHAPSRSRWFRGTLAHSLLWDPVNSPPPMPPRPVHTFPHYHHTPLPLPTPAPPNAFQVPVLSFAFGLRGFGPQFQTHTAPPSLGGSQHNCFQSTRRMCSTLPTLQPRQPRSGQGSLGSQQLIIKTML